MSSLDFNERVLELAEDRDTPLLERVKFAAIFAGNLDEFFQSASRRCGGSSWRRLGLQSVDGPGRDGAASSDRRAGRGASRRHARLFTRDLAAARARESGCSVGTSSRGARGAGSPSSSAPRSSRRWRSIPATHSRTSRILAQPRRLAARPHRPWGPVRPGEGASAVGSVYVAGDDSTFVLLELVIAANLEHLFPGMEILARYPFRGSSPATSSRRDAAEDLLRALEAELRRRRQTGRAPGSRPPDAPATSSTCCRVSPARRSVRASARGPGWPG